MDSSPSVPRDVLAFQLASVLDQLDVDVSRLQLDPFAQTLLTSSRGYVDQVRALCEQLQFPQTAPDALAEGLRSLIREIKEREAPQKIVALANEVRAVSQSIRDLCIGVLSENERQTHAGWTLNS